MKKQFPEKSLNALKIALEVMAVSNKLFRNRLKEEPQKAVIEEFGMNILKDRTIKILEESDSEFIIVLRNPKDSFTEEQNSVDSPFGEKNSLNIDELEGVSAGLNLTHPSSENSFVLSEKLEPGKYTQS